jgi:hypothetical protein
MKLKGHSAEIHGFFDKGRIDPNFHYWDSSHNIPREMGTHYQ